MHLQICDTVSSHPQRKNGQQDLVPGKWLMGLDRYTPIRSKGSIGFDGFESIANEFLLLGQVLSPSCLDRFRIDERQG
jgi:hypothetical protein